MSWHYSQALVAEYSEECSVDGERFALLKSSDMPETYCWHDKTTESSNLFQYGTTCEPSMGDPGEDLLTWYRAAFLVRTSALRERCGDARALGAYDPLYGGRCSELLNRFDRPMYSVKIHQHCEQMDSVRSSKNLPASGMLVDGSLSGLTLLDLIIVDIDYGSVQLPTPTARDWKDTLGMNPKRKDGKTRLDRLPMLLFDHARAAGIYTTTNWANTDARIVTLRGQVEIMITGRDYCPELSEWLMGWPIGWTDFELLATVKFQQWQLWHGLYL